MRIQKIGRWFRYKYFQLLRAEGGPNKVARGFAIGIFVEMFNLPTFGLSFFLIFPLIFLFRANLIGSLIGFAFGKIIYIPLSFLNKQVGNYVLPEHSKLFVFSHLPSWLTHYPIVRKMIWGELDLIVGGMIIGLVLGLIVYYPVVLLLRLAAHRRREKRELRNRHRNVD